MNSLAQNGYTDEQVLRMLEENRAIDFEYQLLDNQERIITTLNCTGSVAFDSKSEIMGTASFEIMEENLQDFMGINSDMRIKPYFKVMAPRGWLKYPLGIYIMTSPKRAVQGYAVYWNVDCYDKGIILHEDKLTDRLYIPSGANYIAEVKKVLLSAGIQTHIIENSLLETPMDLEFEIGTSKLTVINDLLYAINYYPMHFDVNGNAMTSRYIEPMQRVTEYGYMTNEKSLILEGSTQSNDMYNVPNVVIRYVDNPDTEPLRSEYVNENPESIVSTVRRGRKIVDVDTVDDIADQDTLDSYTKRVAAEKSQIYDSVYLPTGLMPHHGFKNCLFLRHDELGIETKYIEYSWEMELKTGGRMTHELKRVVYV